MIGFCADLVVQITTFTLFMYLCFVQRNSRMSDKCYTMNYVLYIDVKRESQYSQKHRDQ